jgi:hypothetical protein
MTRWQPDPSFYPSPRLAEKAPPEKLAYVAMFDPDRQRPDGIAVVDLDPSSPSYTQIVGTVAAVLHGSIGGRTEPTPSLCLSDADGLRAPELKHPVQGMDCNGDLGSATLVGP